MQNNFPQAKPDKFEQAMTKSMADAIEEQYGKYDAVKVAQNVLNTYLKKNFPLMERRKIRKSLKNEVHKFLNYSNESYHILINAEEYMFGTQAIPSSKVFGMQKEISIEALGGEKYSIVDFFLLDDTGGNKTEMQFVQLTGDDAGKIIPRKEMIFEKLPESNIQNLQFSVSYKDYKTTFKEELPLEMVIIPNYSETNFYGKEYFNLDKYGYFPEFQLIAQLSNDFARNNNFEQFVELNKATIKDFDDNIENEKEL